jgi:hypothetical protein
LIDVEAGANLMSRIIFSFVVLFAVDRGCGLALEHVARGVYDGERTGGLVRAVIDHPEARVLLLGSSRVRRHLDPRRFESALGRSVRNAGCDGQGIAYARAVAALARARGSRAELYVVDLNPFDLIDARESRAGVLSPFYGEVPVVDELLASRSEWAPIYLESHAYRFNSAALPLVFRAMRGQAVEDDRGFSPLARRERPRDVDGPDLEGDEASTRRGLAHYRALVREARAGGVSVVFVVGPVRGGWSAADLDRIELLARAVRDEGASVIDLRDAGLDSSRWVDAIHLDAEGADELSRRVAESLVPESLVPETRVPEGSGDTQGSG